MASKNSKDAQALLEQTPEPMCLQMFRQLKERYEGGRRSQAVPKEDLLGASAEIFTMFERREFNLPQQRTTLKYCIELVERAASRWKNPGQNGNYK